MLNLISTWQGELKANQQQLEIHETLTITRLINNATIYRFLCSIRWVHLYQMQISTQLPKKANKS